jgi:hypothetical protein
MPDVIHLLKEKTHKGSQTKCGRLVKWATFWHGDVTCPECLEAMRA